MKRLPEQHEREQYFFDQKTLHALADLLAAFERPCLLCAPMLGRHLHDNGRDVRLLDVDQRFADLPGFVAWDIRRPRHLEERFDLIFCDPPFFNVSLRQLYKAVRMLSHFDFAQPLAVTYLARREAALLGAFASFGLRPTGLRSSYETVQACEKNDIRLYVSFDLPARARSCYGLRTMIIIDGSMGEGGGQVLRTSLGLSLVTGKPFRIENIRAGRERPGLMRQHLTAVHAAAEVSQANVAGDAIGSGELEFEPGQVRPGEYEFAVGTAGSATLVLQTVLPALVVANGPSRLTLKGGTHNPWSPPFDFLAKAFLPLLGRMGAAVTARLIRPGFYPAGGGEFTVEITPAAGGRLQSLELMERGEIVSRRARAIVAKLPEHIAQRELRVVEKKLGWSGDLLAIEQAHDSVGPGNILMLEIAGRNVTEVFTAFGQKDVRAEAVAHAAVDEARAYLAAGVPVGPHLADQLLIPLAMIAIEGAGGGRFRTIAPTRHTITNIEVIRKFMDVAVAVTRIEEDRDVWEIRIGGRS